MDCSNEHPLTLHYASCICSIKGVPSNSFIIALITIHVFTLVRLICIFSMTKKSIRREGIFLSYVGLAKLGGLAKLDLLLRSTIFVWFRSLNGILIVHSMQA